MYIIGTRAKVRAFRRKNIYHLQDDINWWVDKEEVDIVNISVSNDGGEYVALVTYLEKVVR